MNNLFVKRFEVKFILWTIPCRNACILFSFTYLSFFLWAPSPYLSLELSPLSWEASTSMPVLPRLLVWGGGRGLRTSRASAPTSLPQAVLLLDLKIHIFSSPGYLNPIVSHVLQTCMEDQIIIVPPVCFSYIVPTLINGKAISYLPVYSKRVSLLLLIHTTYYWPPILLFNVPNKCWIFPLQDFIISD